jgi:monofunctional biosynthetic peptidoglycan transglycosylase
MASPNTPTTRSREPPPSKSPRLGNRKDRIRNAVFKSDRLLATDARLQGARVSYRASFATTADTWINVKIPLASLSPTYRGTTLQGPPVNLSQIEEIGLLIGDKREGNFALAVDWIKTE